MRTNKQFVQVLYIYVFGFLTKLLIIIRLKLNQKHRFTYPKPVAKPKTIVNFYVKKVVSGMTFVCRLRSALQHKHLDLFQSDILGHLSGTFPPYCWVATIREILRLSHKRIQGFDQILLRYIASKDSRKRIDHYLSENDI